MNKGGLSRGELGDAFRGNACVRADEGTGRISNFSEARTRQWTQRKGGNKQRGTDNEIVPWGGKEKTLHKKRGLEQRWLVLKERRTFGKAGRGGKGT